VYPQPSQAVTVLLLAADATGKMVNPIAPKIGNAFFAARLKNSLLD
jgi:hypothetical protein